MYNKIKEKIAAFIKENKGAGAKEVIRHFNRNASGIFRHLKKLQDGKLIYKVGKPPKVRYYAYTNTMKNNPKIVLTATNWAVSGGERWITPQQLCQTRDVFDARYYRLLTDLKKILKDENIISLVMAAVGEIGNNSFDHNLGHWRDIPGVFFFLDEAARTIVLADRGQGICATLRRVRPEIRDDAEALQVAFTETVSGRAPERRGNGLKMVKKVVEENNLYLEFYTGEAMATITGKGMTIKKSDFVIPGTFAFITF